MSSIAPVRPHFQQLASLVHSHAAARKWPPITYQAAYRTVFRAGTGRPTLEGNSIFWSPDWDADAASAEHAVGVESGEKAWHAFLLIALYPDLLRADTELLNL